MIKYKCKKCGYTQDFKPTKESNKIFKYKLKDNQCPSCFEEDAIEKIN